MHHPVFFPRNIQKFSEELLTDLFIIQKLKGCKRKTWATRALVATERLKKPVSAIGQAKHYVM